MSADTVLVTGGSGFIGTWVLRELLHRGLRVVVLDQHRNDIRWNTVIGTNANKIAFVPGSLLDQALLRSTCESHSVSHFIHLAALLTPDCQKDPFKGCEVNVLGSTALFEQARLSGGAIRGISYASSYAVYGPEADDTATGISAADNRPPSFYGAFKLAVDSIAEQYWRHFQIRSVGIRPHVVYGPERTVGLTAAPSLAAKAVAQGESYTINYTGAVGYDYVEDVANAFVRAALETPPGSVVVDLPSESATPQQFVQKLEHIVPQCKGKVRVDGAAIPSNIPPKPCYISSLFPDWKPTTLEQGIQQTVDFYRQ